MEGKCLNITDSDFESRYKKLKLKVERANSASLPGLQEKVLQEIELAQNIKNAALLRILLSFIQFRLGNVESAL